MRMPQKKITPSLYLTGLLLLLGAALLAAPSVFEPRRSEPELALLIQPRPSPTWQSLPTRIPPSPTVTPPPDVLPLHTALLQGDLGNAAELWTELLTASPEPSGDVYKAGARLAMMQGRLNIAAERAWHAIGAEPTDAEAWSLLGVVLRIDDQSRMAEQALSIADALDPALGPDLFGDRWHVALTGGSAVKLAELAGDYQLRHPDSVWLPYYQAEALMAAGEPLDAIDLLVPVLSQAPASPALLWYALGRAYLARGGYLEAATAFEAAAARTYQGDTSMAMISRDPLRDLNTSLAQSYLGSERCREAEMIFRRLQDADPSLAGMVEAAVICQTPTPTLTPWIPKQIGTVTPRP